MPMMSNCDISDLGNYARSITKCCGQQE